MSQRPLTRVGYVVAALAVALAGVAGCTFPLGAEAHDEWKRSYALKEGGSIEIRNTIGDIRVEQGSGNTVEVAATRSARAGNDEDARNALKRIEIVESVTPDKIELDSSKGGNGLEIHVSRSVSYVVRVPRSAKVTLVTTNGDIVASGIGGAFRAESTNGSIKATSLDGAARLQSTNGDVTVEVNTVADAGVTCSTSNGEIDLTLPSASKASLEAETSNGDIEVSGLHLQASEQTRTKLQATMGGGGPSIKLETTNGGIRIKGR